SHPSHDPPGAPGRQPPATTSVRLPADADERLRCRAPPCPTPLPRLPSGAPTFHAARCVGWGRALLPEGAASVAVMQDPTHRTLLRGSLRPYHAMGENGQYPVVQKGVRTGTHDRSRCIDPFRGRAEHAVERLEGSRNSVLPYIAVDRAKGATAPAHHHAAGIDIGAIARGAVEHQVGKYSVA